LKTKDPFIITEYGKIVSGKADGETNEDCLSIPEKAFEELTRFVKEYNGNPDSDSLDVFGVGYSRFLGDYIVAKNYVGLIELKSHCQIQILPKLELGESLEETQKVFRRMLSSMKDFPAKITNDASLKYERMNLYEIFIQMYLDEVRNLLKKGIKASYVKTEENLGIVKGHIVFSEHIKRNAGHKEKFYISFDEYNVNRPENKLIKSTLLKLQMLTDSDKTMRSIRDLLFSFDAVDESKNFAAEFSKVQIDRNMKNYKNLIEWSKVFLFDKSFSTFSGQTQARALLFPMEKLFESYVAKEIQKVLPSDWSMSTQDSGYYLFDDPQMFRIRPDLVIRTKDDKTIVLDTKWKKLIPNERKNYGISQADMYQMYAYSKKYGASDIWVLYPETKEMNNGKEYTFSSSVSEDDRTTVHLFFVNIGENQIGGSMEELIKCLSL